MLYLTFTSSLKILQLAPSQYTQLFRNNINNLGELFSRSVSDWERLFTRGLVKQLKDKIPKMHWNGQGVYLADSHVVKAEDKNGNLFFLYLQGNHICRTFFRNDALRTLSPILSSRALRSLYNNGITTIGDLIDAPSDFLINRSRSWAKTMQELSIIVPILKKSLTVDAQKTAEYYCQESQIIKMLSTMIDAKDAELRRIVLLACMQENDSPIMERLDHMGFIQENVKEKILSLLDDHHGELSVQKLREQMPVMVTDTLFHQYLHELENDEKIFIDGNNVAKHYPQAIEYASSLPNPTARGIMLDRLHGMVLSEVGKKYGLSRERIRQIWQKNIDEAPLLEEDQYRYIWENYQFESPEDFKKAFHESDVTVNYLDARYKKHRDKNIKDISEILSDAQVSQELRIKAKKAVYKNYVTIDQIHIRKNRPHLVRYVIKNYCQKPTSFDDFINLYQNFLNHWGLSKDPSLIIKSRGGEKNNIANYDYVLWNHNETFRYYDIGGEDFSELLDALNIDSLENIDFSTLKLFRAYPDLMKKYDIRDEFELHNLLKKLWDKNQLNDHKDASHKVCFARMPTIIVGKPSRYRQVMDLLENKGTISGKDLCQAYEDEYGVRAATVTANYLPPFTKYFHNGVYSVEWVPMNSSVQKYLKQLLCKDFYLNSEIKKLFQLYFPEESQESLNPHTLQEIGFLVHSRYTVRGTYGSASSYFRHFLTSQEIINLKEQKSLINYLSTFYQVLTELKQEGEIAEAEPWIFVRKAYLENHGWNRNRIDEFTKNLASSIPEGTFFTMESLQEDGLWKPDPDERLRGWFASSLLSIDTCHFSYIRLGSSRLMYRGTKPIKIIDFYRWLAAKKHITNLHALESVIKRYYHLSFQKYKAKEIIHNEDDLNSLFYMQSNA